MSVTLDCSKACERIVVCTICKRRKAPIGRSVPPEMTTSYCTDACNGYRQEPRSNHLWPGEFAQSRSKQS